MKFQHNSHDLNLSSWGPYTKKYAGISHVADPEQGIRFDLSVFPGLYRRKVEVPNVMVEGNYNIWEANADLTYFSTRHQLEEKDQVYCDISYSKMEDDAYLIRMECVNHSRDIQNLVLHYMASIHYPHAQSGTTGEKIIPVQWKRPDKSLFCRAIDYKEFHRARPLPTDSLVSDGQRPNEIRGNGFSGGSAVKLQAGAGESILFELNSPFHFTDPVLAVRYQSSCPACLTVDGDILTASGSLPNQEAPGIAILPVSRFQNSDRICFCLYLEEGSLLLDSLILCEKQDVSTICCQTPKPQYIPQAWEMGADSPVEWETMDRFPLVQPDAKTVESEQNTLILKYPDADAYYGLFWDFPDFSLRYWLTDELDYSLRYMAHDHVHKLFRGNGQGHFSNVFLRPIPVAPGQVAAIYGLVCCGKSKVDVEKTLSRLINTRKNFPQVAVNMQATALEANGNPEGQPYHFSQNRMMATTLTNVVYPVYTKRSYIRHNTPGRWWDCLYTWDSGFVGLGLSACDLQRAADCLNAYVTEPGDTETAFIHHGSPVPVQFYLFQELYNRTQSAELLRYFYPRLLQYYRFMTGQLGSSTTNPWKSGLLCTWDYFYNSGGWDDYPPQAAVHEQKLEGSAAGMVTTSHMIRCAKILQFAAQNIGGLENDIASLERDIQRMTQVIQEFCWDEPSGYFGYLLHSQDGVPTGILRHTSGQNYNMGLDGASPMIAGIVTPSQLKRLTGHLSSRTELWTPIGLSTVDQSAAYYRKDGYWNGAVWMPHQWFFYKALLDYGNGELAYQIAKTALDLWKNEVDQSYNCYEHFIIVSGRGAGWHHFSGLSTPVLLWYRAYYLPGTITTGFSGWIAQQKWRNDRQQMECTIIFSDHAYPKTILIVMQAGNHYRITVNGESFPVKMRTDGAIELTFDDTFTDHIDISITKAE